jgi:3'-5' exoribonuclease
MAMAKTRYVRDFKEGEAVRDIFLVASKAVQTSSSGKPYIAMTLRDRTGAVECRVWDRAEEIGRRFERDDVVEATGTAIVYQGRVQLKVFDVRKVPPAEIPVTEFLPVTERGIEPLWGELRYLVETVGDPHLRRLLDLVFPDPPESETARRFREAPGGKTMHHDYIGGLMEHTVSVAGMCRWLAKHYGERVNGDLLVAGALLHDLGKVRELSYEGAFDYTDEGRLLGHIFLGAEEVQRWCESFPGFPRELTVLLVHMILSHHGEYAYGSPKRPKTVEAVILHFVENMDAKVASFLDALSDLQEGERWTGYQRMFERFLFSGKFEGDEEKP